MGQAPLLALLLVAAAGPAVAQPISQSKVVAGGDPASECEVAIQHAEKQYALPHGMLLAIGLAESGRFDPTSHRTRPWPWAVQDGERSLYFETKPEAVAWVAQARQQGKASIDTGCLQVNLFYHAAAFASLEVAFDPASNVDYAARFLLRLYAESNDWATAIGFYHSRTESLALPYRERVQTTMGMPPSRHAAIPAEPTVAARLALAWRATSPSPSPGGVEGSSAGHAWTSLLPAAPPISHPPGSQRTLPMVSSQKVHIDGTFYLATTTGK